MQSCPPRRLDARLPTRLDLDGRVAGRVPSRCAARVGEGPGPAQGPTRPCHGMGLPLPAAPHVPARLVARLAAWPPWGLPASYDGATGGCNDDQTARASPLAALGRPRLVCVRGCARVLGRARRGSGGPRTRTRTRPPRPCRRRSHGERRRRFNLVASRAPGRTRAGCEAMHVSLLDRHQPSLPRDAPTCHRILCFVPGAPPPAGLPGSYLRLAAAAAPRRLHARLLLAHGPPLGEQSSPPSRQSWASPGPAVLAGAHGQRRRRGVPCSASRRPPRAPRRRAASALRGHASRARHGNTTANSNTNG